MSFEEEKSCTKLGSPPPLIFPTAATAKCEYSLDESKKKKSPHIHIPFDSKTLSSSVTGISDSILSHVGKTPMVRISDFAKEYGIECDVVAKCEYLSAGGSVKDRIGYRMITDAEKSGRITKGDTLIEPTSGNTGIGLALTAAILGYKMVITLPEKMSSEKVCLLRALGAKIYRTPTLAAFDSPESHIGLAARLQKDLGASSHILDQYSNPSNPMAHYDGTANEIFQQCAQKIDMLVLTAGTGGTITGCAAKLKELNPNIIIVGVDPEGSILAAPDSLNTGITSYHVEGIGYDFVPQVLQRNLVDYWVKTNDLESFSFSRKLIRQCGLLVGGSSGSCMAGAIRAIKHFGFDKKKDKRVCLLMPDSIRNYMSKFLSDDWCIENGFSDAIVHSNPSGGISNSNDNDLWWHSLQVSQLPMSPPITMTDNLSCKNAIDIMISKKIDQIPVIDDSDQISGVVTVGDLSSKLLKGRVSSDDCVGKVSFKKWKKVKLNTDLKVVSKIFDVNHFVLVVSEQEMYSFDAKNIECKNKQMVVGILTRIDLLHFIVKNKPTNGGKKNKNSDDSKKKENDTQDIE